VFIVTGLNEVSNILTDSFINSFEDGDDRRTFWIGEFNTGSYKVYFPYKYKLKSRSTSLTEYSTILRLAEQYLIRAEAYANQDMLIESIRDLDTLRSRSNLPLIVDTNPSISKSELLLAIQKERKIELFTEGAHRWFDLKRTDSALDVLRKVKTNITNDDLLFPIPQAEFGRNPALGNQNSGY